MLRLEASAAMIAMFDRLEAQFQILRANPGAWANEHFNEGWSREWDALEATLDSGNTRAFIEQIGIFERALIGYIEKFKQAKNRDSISSLFEGLEKGE